MSGNELVSEKAQGGRAMAAKAGRGSEAGAGGRAFSGREQNRQGRQVGNWQGNLGSSEQRGLEVLGAPITPPGAGRPGPHGGSEPRMRKWQQGRQRSAGPRTAPTGSLGGVWALRSVLEEGALGGWVRRPGGPRLESNVEAAEEVQRGRVGAA